MFLLLVTTQFQNVEITSTFHLERLRIIDSSKVGSYLIRGNVPLNGSGDFDVPLLRNSINKRLGVKASKLIVVSLLSSRYKDEAAVLKRMRQSRPEQRSPHDMPVELIHVPVAGSWFSFLPSWLPVDTTGGAWELSTRLHSLLSGSDRGTVIYVHCMRGVDRTGLVAGTYKMRYRNATLEDVQQENWNVASRYLQMLEERSLQAACKRLYRSRKANE